MDEPPCVLLVDDYEDGRALFAHWLRREGYRVVEAADGQQCLDLARAAPPAVIVLDLSLPILDGREVARRLRADPRTQQTPIVAVTGHEQGSADRSAFDAWLTKPCTPTSLLAAIHTAIEKRRG